MGIMPVVAGVAQAKAQVDIKQAKAMFFMGSLQPMQPASSVSSRALQPR
jgi:hypothetical protein